MLIVFTGISVVLNCVDMMLYFRTLIDNFSCYYSISNLFCMYQFKLSLQWFLICQDTDVKLIH